MNTEKVPAWGGRPSRRRIARRLAAVLSAVALAATTAVMLPLASPASAANTAVEALVDTDDDETPDGREFAGRDRYQTALMLAENFAAASGGIGAVETVFLASGESLVDAVSVSGLAGYLDAPVLLTMSDMLDSGVADFIEDYGVSTVYVLGGRAAVSRSVENDVLALENEPEVMRLAGENRYATAARIAEELGAGSAWCGSSDAAAIVVNGGDVSLLEAMVIGPIANRLQLPVLLTHSEMLPLDTADFLITEDIEHAVIVGNTDSVSTAVQSDLRANGVSTVERISGLTAAGTAVAVADLLTGDCSDDLSPVSSDTVALVNMTALADGIPAAPVLSSSYDEGAIVPMLVVERAVVPGEVRDYLAGTDDEDDSGSKLELRIVAIGGTAVVTPSVMASALDAAASADALTVGIGNGGTDVNEDGELDASDAPQEGDTTIRLYFSDDVDSTLVSNAIHDLLFINGVPALVSGVQHGTDDVCDAAIVTVTVPPLDAKDVISFSGGVPVGVGGDAREVSPVISLVSAAERDRTRPTIDVAMIVGQTSAKVTISDDTDDDLVLTAAANADDVTLRSSDATKTVTIGDGALTFAPALAAGDRVTIASGAIEDAAGNKNIQRSFTAKAPQASPRIVSILMSKLSHTAQVTDSIPAAITGGAGTADDKTDAPDIWVKARAHSAVDGAAGNDWSIEFYKSSSYDADADVDIESWVDDRSNRVVVHFNGGAPKFSDLTAELESNAEFNSLFELVVDADPATVSETSCGRPSDASLTLASLTERVTMDFSRDALTTKGRTAAALEVNFKGYVGTVSHDELLDDVLAGVVKRTEAENDDDAKTALGLTSLDTFAGPDMTVRYEVTTTDVESLPAARDLVVTAAGTDSVTAVATGYVVDVDTTPADESKNAASQVRIRTSVAVEPPEEPVSD